MASWNVRGLLNIQNFAKVQRAFAKSNYNILCLQETWQNEESLALIEDVSTFTLFASAPKPNGAKGESDGMT